MKLYRFESSNGEVQYSPLDEKKEREGFLSAILKLEKGRTVLIEATSMPEEEYNGDSLENAEWDDLSR
jgi:hypothetical protein